jgi:putative redox protein
MTHEVHTQWMGKMQFNALVNGHTITMDAPERAGGEDNGPIPKPFVLTALSGCTGMDVVALLRKEGRTLTNLDISVAGTLSKRAPIEYVAAHITFNITGTDDDRQATLDAITASQEHLCGVSSMMKKAMPVSWQVIYNGSEVFNNQAVSVSAAGS